VSLRIRRVEHEAEFQGLAGVWADLAERGGQTSPFLSHDWFACCWPAVGSGRHPEVLLVEEGGQPVAAVPLMRWKERQRWVPSQVRSMARDSTALTSQSSRSSPSRNGSQQSSVPSSSISSTIPTSTRPTSAETA